MAAGLAARLFARFTLALILASVLAVVLESEPRIRESAGAMTFFEVRDARPHASGGDGGPARRHHCPSLISHLPSCTVLTIFWVETVITAS